MTSSPSSNLELSSQQDTSTIYRTAEEWNKMRQALGDGPMRFATAKERPFSEQLASLTTEERACFDDLKTRWTDRRETKKADKDADTTSKDHVIVVSFSDEMILRFARCSPGAQKFNANAAWNVMKRFDPKYLSLTAADLEQQLLSTTLFPVPGLVSTDGHDVFYMRPSRYFPRQTSVTTIIDNLAYCMNTMVEKEVASTQGIAFLANMKEWTMANFGVDYCWQFMKMLQGRIPVRVRLFLIVDPPSWFGKIWAIMKPMLAKDFRSKVHMISQAELSKFLKQGYQEYLPDDMVESGGKASTNDLVQDYVTYRKHVEQQTSGTEATTTSQ